MQRAELQKTTDSKMLVRHEAQTAWFPEQSTANLSAHKERLIITKDYMA